MKEWKKKELKPVIEEEMEEIQGDEKMRIGGKTQAKVT